MLRRLAALLCPLVLIACAGTPPSFTAPLERSHPLVGKLWLPAENRFTSVDEVVARARAAQAVLLGETHDNPDHHALQAWMVRRITADGARPLVAFEMITPDQAPALRRHLAEHPGDADGLGAALAWEKSNWPDWALYRPIAAAALDADSPLAAANLGTAGIAEAKADKLALPPLPADQVTVMEQEIRDGHCGMLPESAVAPMVRIQRGRDAAMAAVLAEGVRANGQAVLIAGTGHTRRDHAVPAVLAIQAPQTRVFTLGFLEVRSGRDTPTAYETPFDAVWFTPAAEREDMCAAFKRHMEKKTSPSRG